MLLRCFPFAGGWRGGGKLNLMELCPIEESIDLGEGLGRRLSSDASPCAVV